MVHTSAHSDGGSNSVYSVKYLRRRGKSNSVAKAGATSAVW